MIGSNPVMNFADRIQHVVTRGPEHRERLRSIDTRIVVSGTRGKSGTTERLHDILTDRGYDTAAKITGNRPIVLHNGERHPIERGPKVTMYENEREIRKHTPDDALIVENQAIREYTNRVLSDLYVDPNVLVLTNLRQDHLDTLGGDREGIARSLVRSIPDGTHVVNGEQNPELQRYIDDEIAAKDATVTHVDVPAEHADVPGAETIYALAETVRIVDEPLPPDRLERYLEDMRVSWTELPGGRVYNAAQVNDVESTEAVRRSLQRDRDEPSPLTVFMYLRDDRRARTASFIEYLNELEEDGHVDGVHVAGSPTSVFARKVNAPVVEHDESAVSAGEVLSEMLEAGRPVYIVGNTVASFMRDMEDEIDGRTVQADGRIDPVTDGRTPRQTDGGVAEVERDG